MGLSPVYELGAQEVKGETPTGDRTDSMRFLPCQSPTKEQVFGDAQGSYQPRMDIEG